MPEESFEISRIDNSSTFQFIKSRDDSKNKYYARQDHWNDKGFMLKQNNICEIDFA